MNGKAQSRGRKESDKAADGRAVNTADVAAAPAVAKSVRVAAKVGAPKPAQVKAGTLNVETAPKAKPAQAVAAQKGTTMNDTVNKIANETAERAQAAMEKGAKFFEDINEFNKGNIEALVESSKVAAKAAETLGQQAAEAARKNYETASTALKNLASVKSPTELFQLQSEYARNAFDAFVAQASKNSETVIKLASEVVQPLSSRFAVAAEKVKKAA